jgi:hypothetical protein
MYYCYNACLDLGRIYIWICIHFISYILLDYFLYIIRLFPIYSDSISYILLDFF